MWPKVSVFLTKKRFLFTQENLHASKSFWKIYPLNVLQKWTLFLAGPQAIQISCQLCSYMDIKDSWAHQILQRANKNFEWPIKIWKCACIGMGYGPLVHFKDPSSFWAKIIPEWAFIRLESMLWDGVPLKISRNKVAFENLAMEFSQKKTI